jgi:hypothetical protein
MSRSVAAWLAWSVCGLTLTLIACAYALITLLPPAEAYSFMAPLGAAPFALVGVLIASRLPQNPVGWFLVGSAAIIALQEFMVHYVAYGLVTHPGSLPLAHAMAWLLSWTYVPGFVLLFIFLPLYFPESDERPLIPHGLRGRICIGHKLSASLSSFEGAGTPADQVASLRRFGGSYMVCLQLADRGGIPGLVRRGR